LLLCAAAAGFGKFNLATCLALFGLLALYGAVDELTQGLTHSRFPDAWDLAADLVGAALGMLLFAIGWQFFRQRPTA
jgi:VanZ family protein